jgi:hypothetical protein
MSRIILACALAGIMSVSAKADETLKLRWTAHATAPVQFQEVGDVEGHTMGVSRYSGLIFTPDGSSAGTLYYTTTFDFIKGNGAYSTYVNLTFSDGSVLWYKVNGSAKLEGAKSSFPGGAITVLSGKGRFEGAKGDGTVSGMRIGPVETGADSYGDLVINVKK